MKITSISYRLVESPWREPLTLANGVVRGIRNWLVFLVADGMRGIGSAAASPMTRESCKRIGDSLGRLRGALEGKEVADPEMLHARMDRKLRFAPAAKAAIDLAFYDVLARSQGRPLYSFLGGDGRPMPADMTLGIASTPKTVGAALRYRAQGFTAFKLKVGTSFRTDIERVLAVRDAVGEAVALRIDANQGYTKKEALRFAEAVAGAGIEFIEQPIRAGWWNWRAMAELARTSPVPIMADESVKGPDDAERAFERGIRLVNIKLMKCGGIHHALHMVRLARRYQAWAMIGCMAESGVSLAGALHLAAACPDVVKWLDLDSHFMLERDACKPLRFKQGMLWPEGPGNGVTLTPDVTPHS